MNASVEDINNQDGSRKKIEISDLARTQLCNFITIHYIRCCRAKIITLKSQLMLQVEQTILQARSYDVENNRLVLRVCLHTQV